MGYKCMKYQNLTISTSEAVVVTYLQNGVWCLQADFENLHPI